MSFASLILVVLAASPQGADDKHAPKAAEGNPLANGSLVYACDFGTTADRNYDGWPDGWTRRHGGRFHDFLKIGIAEDKTDPARGSIFVLEMNGGSAEAGSPNIPITPGFSYKLEGDCRLTDLVHDDVRVTLTYLTAKGKATGSHSVTIGPATGSEWQSFQLAPPPPDRHTVAAVIALQVAPRGLHSDLKGHASFRRLRVQRLPRMTIRTGNPLNIFTAKEQVEVQCEIVGIPHAQTTLQFELLDHEGRLIASQSQPLVSGSDAMAHAAWRPPLPDFGFYHVKVGWQGKERETLVRSGTIAVVHRAELPKSGQFGWTLPAGEAPLENGNMASLLAQAGVHWAKYPVSISATDAGAADRIAWFAEKLSLHGIEMVGMLDHPPGRDQEPIADTLVDETIWQPWVDPIMTRLSLKVRWWQLGADSDTSLVGYPRLAEKTREVKSHLERFGQQVKLGTSWQWLSPPPPADAPLAMHGLTSDPPLTATELGAYLTPRAPADNASPQRWVVLEPLPKSDYSLATRAHDLATRMLAAKVAGADAIFLTRPFDAETGVMQTDGATGELFIPWRTTAAAVSGAEYLGQLQLPSGSTNYVFARGGRAVMAVWNEKLSEEAMFFGEDLRQIDLWGRETVPPAKSTDGHVQHCISVATLPTFITGLNEQIARFKLSATFESSKIESVFNREQTIYLRLKNFFPQGISGEVKRVAPAGWKPDTQGTRFRLAPGEEVRLPITVQLFAEASSGPQPLRLDFNLAADRTYQFSVHRTLQLGLADVAIEMTSRLRDDGILEVTQQLTNLTDKPLGFQCVLFPSERRRETRQVIAAPHGQTPLLFLLEDGKSLIGQKLTLRAEELGGGRLLNYTLTAER